MSDNDFSQWNYEGEWQRAFREGAAPVKDYPDILGEPIYVDPKLWPPEQIAGEKIQRLATKAQLAYQEKIDRFIGTKWELLFWMYGIDPRKLGPAAAWEHLARALVGQHVPGFSFTNKPPAPTKPKLRPGRPAKYTMDDHFNRVMQVKREEAEIARRHPNWPAERLMRRAVENLVARFPERWPESKDGKPNLDSAVQLFYDSYDAMIDYAAKHGRLYDPAKSLAELGTRFSQTPPKPTIEEDLKSMLQIKRLLFDRRNDLTPSEFRHQLRQFDANACRYVEIVKRNLKNGRREVAENGHKHPKEKVQSVISYLDKTHEHIREFEQALGKLDQEFS